MAIIRECLKPAASFTAACEIAWLSPQGSENLSCVVDAGEMTASKSVQIYESFFICLSEKVRTVYLGGHWLWLFHLHSGTKSIFHHASSCRITSFCCFLVLGLRSDLRSGPFLYLCSVENEKHRWVVRLGPVQKRKMWRSHHAFC